MDSARHCAQCGAMLGAYALEGVCGNCLLKPGLEPMLARLDETGGQTHPAAFGLSSNRSGNAEKGSRFGDYELLEEIARGGMGIVYRARQVSLDRIVAVKMLLAGPLAGKDFVQRFRTEAAAAASLQHANIVAIHEVGFAEGQHFFAMDYVEGLTLAQLVTKGPLPARKAATYLKAIAEAIHFAHERNVLHRDLKPSNVLIDSATDQPRVTDFGLAKRLDAETDLTLSGQLLGSPNYVSPEQAAAKRGAVSKRSDVYSLGAILYHLLTGRPPFQGETLTDVLRQLADNDPPAPRVLTSGVPRDLETICLKCLQKEPSRRYQSAQELADELDRFLHHKPIQARPITRTERGWRWCGRNPVVASLGLALVFGITVGFAGVLVELRRVQQREAIVRRDLYTADMNLAFQDWQKGNLQRPQELLRAYLPQPGKEDLRGFEWRYLTNLCQDESLFTFTNIHFAGRRRGLALAAEGQTVIAASDDTLKWLDGQKQREMQSIMAGPKAVTVLSMAVDQPGLLAYRTDRVKARSPAGKELLGAGLSPDLGGSSYPDPDFYGAFAFSRDGALLAIAGTNCTVCIFDMKTGKALGPEMSLGESEDIWCLAFSPDAKYLACGALGNIHVLEAPVLKQVKEFKAHTSNVLCLEFDPTGKKLVSNSVHIRVWSFPDCAPTADLPGHQGGLDDLAFSPDGLRLASGGDDQTVRLWNAADPGAPTFLRFFRGHRDAVTSVLFSRDGNQLYSGSRDGTVKVWDMSSRESTNILNHSGWADEVSFSPDGTLLAVTDYHAHTAVLWDVASRKKIENLGEHSEACRDAKFSFDGQLLATVGETVQIMDISTRKKVFEFRGGSPAFHPSNYFLAVARGDLRFWDLQNGTQMSLLTAAPTKGVESVVFSPNGKQIALGMTGGQVSIWDFVGGRLLHSFHEHTNAINVLCFSRDGTFLASGGDDNRVVIYEVPNGPPTRLEGHFNRVFGLAFAPDGKTLVSTGWDGTIRFWSMANHQVALTLIHDGGAVNSVAFSPDGNLMATSGSDGTARLWPAATLRDITTSKKVKENRK